MIEDSIAAAPEADQKGMAAFVTQKFQLATDDSKKKERTWLGYYPQSLRRDWAERHANVVEARKVWVENILGPMGGGNHSMANVHHIRYEDLLADPEKTLKALSTAAGLACDGFEGRTPFVLHQNQVKYGDAQAEEVSGIQNKFAHAQTLLSLIHI